jgi:uncharacterized protein (DUF2062 family)
MTLRQSLRSWIVAPIRQQLTQGLSPEKVALTIGVGLAIAVIPIVGVTTVTSFLAAWALRLNQPIIQTINWSSYALQLLMIFPFIRLGEWIFRAPRLTLSLDELVAMGKADPLGTLSRLGSTLGHAVVAWALVAPLIVAAAYYASRPALRALSRRLAPPAEAPGAARGVDDVA